MTNALRTLPDGDIVAGGSFLGAAGNHLARWNGTTWSAIGLGTSDYVHALTLDAAGSLWIGGSFLQANGSSSPSLARIDTTCPASDSSAGAGCSGSGGPNTLAATSLPWVGSTFRSTASGLPTNGVAIEVLGFAPTLLSLSSLLPQGGAGCKLLVTPVAFGLQLPSSGSVGLQFVVPNDIALVGAIVRQQVLAAELDAQANLVAVTASNALQLVVGAF